jgi:hypothetical protein
MKKKYIAYAAVAAITIIGYNIFLIQRDQKMYDAYYCQTIGCANER